MLSHNPLGDFSKNVNDVVPENTSRRVRGGKALRRLSAGLYNLHNSNLGRALSDEEAKEFLKHTYMDIVIPEEDNTSIDSKYLSNGFINSDEPERLAESKIDVLNSIDISDEEVDEVKRLISETTNELKDTMLKTVVSYIALDNASAIAEAVMRDGIGINLTIDSSVLHSLNDITKLSVVQKLLEHSGLADNVQRAFLLNLTRGLTSDVGPLRKAETAQRYSQVLQNLVLSRKSRSGSDDSETELNPMGIIKKFSNNLKQ